MANGNFPACQAFSFRYEGGYVNHPKDPGKATNLGITKAVLAGWRGRPVTDAEVRALTKREATAIYKANYWTAVRGEDLPKGVDLVVHDYGINSGPSRAIKELQRALRMNKIDGFIGPATLSAANNADPVAVINAVCDLRRKFVRRLKTYKTFGKGWETRIVACRRFAIAMANDKAAPREPVARTDEPQVKADPSEIPSDKVPPIASGSGAFGGGSLIEGAIARADQAADVAQKAEGWLPFIERIATQPSFWIGVAVVGVSVFMLVRYFTKKKDDE